MDRPTRICVTLLFAALGLACGGETASPAPAGATGQGGSSAAPAQPTRPSDTAAAPSGAEPSQPAASGSRPAAMPGEPGEPSGAAPAADEPGETETPATGEMPQMGAGDARYPDACSERRGSWGKPCSTDPDPCNLKSGYPGDEYCLLPPPEGKGVQIHFGPENYTDAAEVAKYLIQPGEEFNQYAIVNIPTTETKYFAYLKISMRPGSHHLINNLIEGHPEEGFVQGAAGCEGSSVGSFPGTQNLIVESPPQGIPAPENEGLGRTLPGNSSLCQNYHRYNTTDKPALSEIWYNIWFVDESEVTQKSSGVMVNAGPWQTIAPGEKIVLSTTADISGEGRIISLFGHRHAATERFAAWLNDELIYDSWDWVESRLFNYDSLTQNPPANPEGKMDGAVSGVLPIKAGDRVKIECHVNNTTDHTLRFANELYTGEMCILFGQTVGTTIGRGGLGSR